MPGRGARRLPMPEKPSAGSVLSLRSRKTRARRQTSRRFPVCAPKLPVSRKTPRRPGEKQTPLMGLRLAAQLYPSLPQATCPPPGVPPGSAPAVAAKAHVKLPGGASASGREFANANPGLGSEAIPGRTRRARGLEGRAFRRGYGEEESAWRSGAGARAVVSPRPRASARPS